jgi:hypothetical protein
LSESNAVVGDHFLLTLRQAAERTGMSATTLRRYIKGGRLRARLVPGRYGPEYGVELDELRHAGLWDGSSEPPAPPPGRGAIEAAPSPAVTGLIVPTPPSPPAVAAEGVPLTIFRELLMKHEQLLVQYGMLRVSGQQVHEVRREAERKALDAARVADEMVRIRDRHAKEIGLLKARLRQAELLLAEREEEIGRLRQEIQRQEMAARNANRAGAIDAEFQRAFVRSADH